MSKHHHKHEANVKEPHSIDLRAYPPMPRYMSRKYVRALEIQSIEPDPRYYSVHNASEYLIRFRDSEYEPMKVTIDIFANYIPVDSDFIVQYEDDGHIGFAPHQNFKAGYTNDLLFLRK
jgi:hypothetical protein